MELLLIALGVCSLLVGATGTWSPCGLSMIETIGPTGHTGGLRTTLAASLTFGPSAVLGGVITFGLLALVGEALHGAGGAVAYAVAAAVALTAAIAEARGLPIVPQVRRQLPVRWRASRPMPLASAGYGILLGLGFTTFILSYGVWALMAVALVVGDPVAGLVIGLAFGVGRALPILALAPIADRPSGERACEAMLMRRGLYRGARLGDAVALLAVAAVLGGSVPAEAAKKEVPKASDPSTAGSTLVYETRDGRAELRRDGEVTGLPGTDPGAGGPYVATIRPATGTISILRRRDQEPLAEIEAPDADAVAISRRWLAYRRATGKKDLLEVVEISNLKKPGKPRRIAKAGGIAQLSRPALDRNNLVYTASKGGRSKLIHARLGSERTGRRTLIGSRTTLLTAPSISGSRIAYVATTINRQRVRVKGLGRGKGSTVHRTRPGPPTLWNTALTGDRVFFTVVKKGGSAKLLSVNR